MASITIELSAPNLELARTLATQVRGVLRQNGPWLTVEAFPRLEIVRSKLEQALGRPLTNEKWHALVKSHHGHVAQHTDQIIIVQDEAVVVTTEVSELLVEFGPEHTWIRERLRQEAARRKVPEESLVIAALERFLRTESREEG
jgi:hypothetical protein